MSLLFATLQVRTINKQSCFFLNPVFNWTSWWSCFLFLELLIEFLGAWGVASHYPLLSPCNTCTCVTWFRFIYTLYLEHFIFGWIHRGGEVRVPLKKIPRCPTHFLGTPCSLRTLEFCFGIVIKTSFYEKQFFHKLHQLANQEELRRKLHPQLFF